MNEKMGMFWWGRFLFVVTSVSIVLVVLEFVTWPIFWLYRTLFPQVEMRPDLTSDTETI